MKLVIQIPCFNEQDCISGVLDSLPKKIFGVREIKIIVIDDCSNDKTVKIASKYDVEIIKNSTRLGLANSFKIGVKKALELNADILVNIDGDNQYCANDIEKLIAPIIEKKADMVIGVRPIDKIKTFSPLKKFLQKFGSFIVKMTSSQNIKDAASGFRAFSREAMLKLNIFNNFTYTIETIIQAKTKGLTIQNININVNEQKNRKSKLFKNNFDYIFKQSKNLIRFFIIYRPYRFFSSLAIVQFLIALLIGLRYLYFYFMQDGSGHIQSLILCAIIFSMSFISFMLAIVGDLFSINRKILEDIQYQIREKKYKK